MAGSTGSQYVTKARSTHPRRGRGRQRNRSGQPPAWRAKRRSTSTPLPGERVERDLVPPTSANIIGLSATITAHELGHLSGLQHQDAIGPIGSGTISDGIDPSGVLSRLPWPISTTTNLNNFVSGSETILTDYVSSNGANGESRHGEMVEVIDITTGKVLGNSPLSTSGAASFDVTAAIGDEVAAIFTSTSGFAGSEAEVTNRAGK